MQIDLYLLTLHKLQLQMDQRSQYKLDKHNLIEEKVGG